MIFDNVCVCLYIKEVEKLIKVQESELKIFVVCSLCPLVVLRSSSSITGESYNHGSFKTDKML